jgi:hypothetical protein
MARGVVAMGLPRIVFFCFLSLLMVVSAEAFAAQQKKTKTAAPPKPIYEAPMRVVVVRNSFPTCEPDCPQWISAEGEITASTPAAFRRVFKQIGNKNLPLVIRSPGGSINAAIEIGKMVRKRKMTVGVGYTLYRGCRPDEAGCKLPKEAKGIYTGSITEFDAFCNSACPMILAAGTTRLATSVAYVGLHEPKTDWTREWVKWRETYKIVKGKKKVVKRTITSRKIVKGKTTYGLDKRLRKQIGNYYKSMGVDLAILEEMQRAKYQDMYWLPTAERDRLRLRTSIQSVAALGNMKNDKPDVSGIEYCVINGAQYVGEICKREKAKPAATTNTIEDATPPGSVKDVKLDISSVENCEINGAIYVGQICAQEKAKQTALATPEMTIKLARLAESACGASCPAWIVLDGRISSNAPELLRAFAKNLGRKRALIVLNSIGGDVDAAIQLGRAIRELGFDTMIGKTNSFVGSSANDKELKASSPIQGLCRGSCLLAFVGGKHRHIDITSNFQIQTPFADVTAGTLQVRQIQMERHLDFMGADSMFFGNLPGLFEETGKGILAENLLTYRIATDSVRNSEFFDRKNADFANQQ